MQLKHSTTSKFLQVTNFTRWLQIEQGSTRFGLTENIAYALDGRTKVSVTWR